MAFFEPIVGGMIQGALGGINNYYSAQREQEARYQNYLLNEKAAENADQRTRALYNDFYSPEALMRQYQKAGLSPSMMFGGTPGQGGTSGAQGAGVNQPSTYSPISIVEGAQAGLMAAQTANIKADTANKEAENIGIQYENTIKEAEAGLKQMENILKNTEYSILSIAWTDKDGKIIPNKTFYSMATESNNMEEFMERIHDSGLNEEQRGLINSEPGQKILRDIFKTAKTMNWEINEVQYRTIKAKNEKDISKEELAQAKFQTSVVNALNEAGFPEINAQATIQVLKTQIAQSELTETQKNAWNRLIDKMGEGTMTDIVIVLLSILQSNVSAGLNLVWKK